MLNPKSIAYTKAHMLGNVSVCVCVCWYVCLGMYVECACDSVGVRSCGLKMDNKKLIATNSCAIFSVRLETLYPEENRWQPERGGEALGVGEATCECSTKRCSLFTAFPGSSMSLDLFCTGSFLAMPSVSYFQLFDPLHFFIAFHPGTI